MTGPAKRREAVEQVRKVFEVSERRACRVIRQARSAQRRKPEKRDDEEQLRKEVVMLASKFGRYGYRRVTGLLHNAGWQVNHKRVERTLAPAVQAQVYGGRKVSRCPKSNPNGVDCGSMTARACG